ncbi:3'-5' exonuclease [Kitasatospora sp. NPDC048545]|uniref:3'-5' exonuclease n=1 Tax=Kitasatospora sp. NPDC048545 TaxID=3157208 RepID=UPI0033DB473F
MDFSSWPRLLVIDSEGNGASPPDLVELAAVPIVNGTVLPAEIKTALVRPPTPISPFATSVHHISNDDVAGAPRWESIAAGVQADLDGVWIAAHNAAVDYNLLMRHLPTWAPLGVVDTLRLARAAVPEAPRHTLDALLTHTRIDTRTVRGARHRAGYDAHVTALLLLTLADQYATWDDLVEVAVPPKMPGRPAAASSGPEEPTLW